MTNRDFRAALQDSKHRIFVHGAVHRGFVHETATVEAPFVLHMQGGVCIALLFGWLWLVDGLVRSSNRITVVKNEAALNKDKVFFPGDYVTHEKYGTGIYKGLATLKIAPKVQSSTSLPVLVVQYSDSELLLSVKQALESLYLHHRPIVEETVDEQIIQIDSACDTKRWQRLKEKSLNTNKK